jgi:hypothetical protein
MRPLENQQEEEGKGRILGLENQKSPLTFLPSRLPVQSPMAQRS